MSPYPPFFTIKKELDNIILASSSLFTFSDTSQFCINALYTSQITEAELKIFPNPTRDIIFIEGYIERETNIQLLNNLGKVVMTSDINFKGVISKQIDISHLPMGVYFIHIKNSTEKIIKKVVKL